MEPITVINLPIELHQFKWRNAPYRVHVFEAPPTRRWDSFDPHELLDIKIVTIYTEKHYRNGRIYPLFITHDEEAAMLLRSEPLPGQQSEYRREYQRGFEKGFAEAVMRGY